MINYDPVTRLFTRLPPGPKVRFGIYSIGIEITDAEGRQAHYELEIDYSPFDERTCSTTILATATQDEDKIPKVNAIPQTSREQYLEDYIAYFERMHQKAEEGAIAESAGDVKKFPTAILDEITQFNEVKIKLSQELVFPDDIQD